MQLPGNNIMQAVCRTLLHSLWQGLIIAVLAGAVVLFTKKLRPTGRYAIFAILLAAFLITAGITFKYELNTFTKQAVAAEAVQPTVATPVNFTDALPAAVQAEKPLPLTTRLFAYFNTHANTIVIGWLLIIAFRCVQMLIGLRGVYILKRKGITGAGEYWNHRLQQLAANIHIKQGLQLFQSAIAKAPMVIGHFKPVILLPAGIITALPQDEIEAILLHELAHIRRKDYLVNMLQNFCEIIFFFNPAVLWLSSLIKDERENCCDDIALTEVKNKKQFIHALISFQEYNIAASKYAPGFPGRKDHLLNRVKRIITNNNKTLTNMEKTFLATGIVLVSFVTITFAQTKKNTVTHTNKQTTEQANEADSTSPSKHSTTTTEYTNNETADNDTLQPGERSSWVTMNTTYEGKRYKFVQDEGKLVLLYIDGERIPEEKLAQYSALVAKIRADINDKMEKQREIFAKQREQFRVQQDAFREQQRQLAEQQRIMMRRNDSLNRNLYADQREQMRQRDTLNRQLYQQRQQLQRQQQEQFKIQREQFRRMRDSLGYSDNDLVGPVPPVEPLAPVEPFVVSADVAPLVAPVPPVSPLAPMADVAPVGLIPPVSDGVGLLSNLRANAAPQPDIHTQLNLLAHFSAPENKTVKDIIRYLEDNNVSIDVENISITLNKNGLLVNGVKQPDALFSPLKKRYIKVDNDHVIYSSHKTSTGKSTHSDISIDNDDNKQSQHLTE